MKNIYKQFFEMRSEGISIVRKLIKLTYIQLFINDYDNVFCPVLDFDIPEFQMNSDQELTTTATEINLQKVKAQYFNALLGDWEPFIENFEVQYKHTQVGTQQMMAIEFP